jgi:hypothetical protein
MRHATTVQGKFTEILIRSAQIHFITLICDLRHLDL